MKYKATNSIPDKQFEKIQARVKQGVRTIFVEGIADQQIYKRFYPNARFINTRGFSSVIAKIRDWNERFGKNPFVVGFIDRDIKTDEEIKFLKQENIFTLGIREIEFIFLRPDVITKLFGEKTFEVFHKDVLENAQNRISEPKKTLDYNKALLILKHKVSSKYCIRLLMKEIGKKNKGMDANIVFLCQKMDEANAWELIEDIIPKIDEISIDDKESKSTKSLDYIKLDYTPIPNFEQSGQKQSRSTEIEK